MIHTEADLLKVEGWALYVQGEEPRVRDIDLAERLEFGRQRDVRKLIRRLAEDGELALGEAGAPHDSSKVSVRATVSRSQTPTGGEVEREVEEYYLTEEQALLVIMASRTKVASAVRKEVVRVFMLARRGLG